MRIIGIIDAEEHGSCDCCGKQAGPELKRLVVLQDCDGEIHHFGATCAANKFFTISGADVARIGERQQNQPTAAAVVHFIDWTEPDGSNRSQQVMKKAVRNWVVELRRDGIQATHRVVETHPAI